MFTRKKNIPVHWKGIIEPFRIIGGVYFVGTYQASSHLIDTGDGLILIDTGYSDSMLLVVDSIHRLGFDPRDIKYIINTHWHWDHTEGTAAMAYLSGAKTLIGRDDAKNAMRYFESDILVDDGDTLSLGNVTIRFVSTPGHTKGCISFFFDVTEGDKVYHVGTFGGAGANTLVPGSYDYDGCREGYLESIKRLRQEKVDVFIGNHVWNNDTDVKGELLLKTGENRFIDDKIFYRFLDHCEERLLSIIEKEKADKKR